MLEIDLGRKYILPKSISSIHPNHQTTSLPVANRDKTNSTLFSVIRPQYDRKATWKITKRENKAQYIRGKSSNMTKTRKKVKNSQIA